MRYVKALCYLTIGVLVSVVMALAAVGHYRSERERVVTQRAWFEAQPHLLNLVVADASDALRAQLKGKLPANGGLVVTRLESTSAELLSGIELNDILLEVAGQPITGLAELKARIDAANGQPLATTVLRRGAKVTVQSKAGIRQGSSIAQGASEHFWLGITTENVDSALASQLGLSDGQDSGVLVMSVTDDSPAAKAGIKPHDILLTYGGDSVTDPKAFPDLVQAKQGQPVAIEIMRGGKNETVTVTAERHAVAQQVASNAGKFVPLYDAATDTISYSVLQPGVVTEGSDPSKTAVAKQGGQTSVGIVPQTPDPAVAKRLDEMAEELRRLRKSIDSIAKLLEPTRAIPGLGK